MNRIDPASVLRHRRDVRYRIVDQEAVVIRQDAGEVLGLNSVGARLLDLMDAKTSVEGLIYTMAKEFDVEREKLEQDVLGFLHELLEAGVIEEIEASEH